MPEMEIVGYVAATLTTFSFLPQALKTIRTKATHGISLTMYLILAFGVILWLIYGFSIMSYPVIFANAITLILAMIILILKLKHG